MNHWATQQGNTNLHMLCGCLEPFSSSPSVQGNDKEEYVSSFPGTRRFVKTGGNALVEYDPSKHGPSLHESSAAVGDSGSIQVSATVPAGISGGQTIHVAAPDGRVIAAAVPAGMQAGSSFIVEFPPATSTTSGDSKRQSATNTVQQSTMDLAPLRSDTPSAAASDSYHGIQVLTPPLQQQTISPMPIPVPLPVASVAPPTSSSINKPILLVKVPPKTAPGTTLHVKIPNTDRMVAAKVPAGVSEFHVAYDADRPPTTSATSDDCHVPLPTPLPLPQRNQTNAPAPYITAAPASADQQQQLILVKTPPGVVPGTTLHVQVPGKDEMIAAQVPPGVTEFHVAYTPPAQGSISQQQQTQSSRGRGIMGGDGGNRDLAVESSDIASMIPIVAGSVLMGAAGVSMLNRHRQMNK